MVTGMFAARIGGIPARRIVDSGVFGCRIVRTTAYEKKGEQY
jgi:hypothetical protein